MKKLANVFLQTNFIGKITTIFVLSVIVMLTVYIVGSVSLFLSTVLNLPGLIVLALLASVSLILFSISNTNIGG